MAVAVLLAAGAGRRFGSKRPKQLVRLNGKPLFHFSLDVFLSVREIKHVFLVVPPGRENQYRKLVRPGVRDRVTVTQGGRFRGESVRNAIRILPSYVEAVLIHDAARPLLTPRIVKEVLKAARLSGVALAAWPVSDTLKKERSGFVNGTIRRDGLWLAQTPQGFRMDTAKACLLRPSSSVTDDVALAERRGFKVKIVVGAPDNIKVTRPDDLRLCAAYIAQRSAGL